jgi:hypothetical protein
LSVLRSGRALLHRNIIFYMFLVRLSKPQGLVQLEGLGKLKKIRSPRQVSSGLWHNTKRKFSEINVSSIGMKMPALLRHLLLIRNKRALSK